MDETVQTFSLEQVGIYLTLLWHQWEHGSIPSRDECSAFPVFARAIYEDEATQSDLKKGCTTSTFQDVLKHVLSRCFPPHPSIPNRYANPRMLQVRLEQEAKSEVFQQRARKGGLARSTSQARFKHPQNVLEASYTESESLIPSSLSSSSKTRQKKSKVPLKSILPDTDWLKALQTDPAYTSLDVPTSIAKCRVWCETNKQTFSKRRIVNWLNRQERPLTTTTLPTRTSRDLSKAHHDE